jgi:hypothetical protein
VPNLNRHSSGLARKRAAAHLALLLGALGTLCGCAAPAPPQPPSASTPAAAAQAKTGQAQSSNSPLQVPQPAQPAALQPPQGLAAIPVRKPTGSLEVDLSWAISGATDLAGYNVYRSRQPDGRRVRLNKHLLAAPAFRDTTVERGASYRYWVTAVDRAANESAPSGPVTVSAPGGGSSH